MPMTTNESTAQARPRGEGALLLAILMLILLVLFGRSLNPSQIIFSNDGPLGASNARSLAMPSAYVSVWADLNFLGNYTGSFLLPITGVLLWILKPIGFAKLYVPLVFLFLGCSAGYFFRRIKLTPAACILGGIAAMLNSEFFSTACWGIAVPATALASCFLALAAIVGDFQRISWMRLALAGLAVGVCVMEAADVGAIFSVFVAAYITYHTLMIPGPTGRKLGLAFLRVSCVTLFALFMAAQSVSGLVQTQIQGVKAAQQDPETKNKRWYEATEWSFPKSEVISLVMPGIFGYGISPREGHAEDQYWGRVGQHVSYEDYFKTGKPVNLAGFVRHTGTGFYSGIMVVMVGLWAAAQALRKNGSVFALGQRKAMWFWIGMFVFSLLMAFGRYAPFYRLFYALPYASAIRNPIKFMHTLNWALIVMFAYGVHGFVTEYLKAPAAGASWWKRFSNFDRKWLIGLGALFVVAVLAVAIFSQSGKQLAEHLGKVGFNDPATAKAIADHSVEAALIFIPRFAAALAVVALFMSGIFAGTRARGLVGVLLLGTVLAIDLATADVPWIKYQDFSVKYASNPIIDMLREKPYEHRVAQLPFQPPAEAPYLFDLYRIEWHQIHFQYYNVQSLEVVQMSRVQEDIETYQHTMMYGQSPTNLVLFVRNWQLSNTRYLLGPTGFLTALNTQLPGFNNCFRIVATFDIVEKPNLKETHYPLEDVTAMLSPTGKYALFEFTAALPRVKLYSNWEIIPKDADELARLTTAEFDPLKSVIVASNAPPAAASGKGSDAGSVEFSSYEPKHIVFNADAKTDAVMLLNDKYDPNWRVTVDGQPVELLRCNYIMRGVYLKSGKHTVKFDFVVSNKPLYFTLAASVLGVALLGVLAVGKLKDKSSGMTSPPAASMSSPQKPGQG